MSLQLPLPILYAITSGATTARTTPEAPEFLNILQFVEAAVTTGVPLIQIREKSLSARVLYELTTRAAAITRNTATRLLVNDRFDIARAAGADGVHLTTRSLPANIVRGICGEEFLIGVSTHSRETALNARADSATFVVFGQLFVTESKRSYVPPQGLEKLREVTDDLKGFPVVAIGGVNLDNVHECFRAGASGMAAIRLFNG